MNRRDFLKGTIAVTGLSLFPLAASAKLFDDGYDEFVLTELKQELSKQHAYQFKGSSITELSRLLTNFLRKT